MGEERETFCTKACKNVLQLEAWTPLEVLLPLYDFHNNSQHQPRTGNLSSQCAQWNLKETPPTHKGEFDHTGLYFPSCSSNKSCFPSPAGNAVQKEQDLETSLYLDDSSKSPFAKKLQLFKLNEIPGKLPLGLREECCAGEPIAGNDSLNIILARGICDRTKGKR